MLSIVVQSRRSRIRAAAVALTAAAALLGSVTPALAHDELVSSNPAADATVAQPPSEVVLNFDEAVLNVGTQVVVTGPDGPASEGSPRLEGTAVHQPLRGGPAGTYSVAWRVTSADGHPVSGTFAFTAQAASPPTSTSTPPSTTTTTPAPSTTTSSTVTTLATSTTSVTVAPASDTSSGSPWLVVLVVLVVAALALGGWAVFRRRGTPPEAP